MIGLAAVAVAAFPLVAAFQGTVPLVVKSSISDRPSTLDQKLPTISQASDVYSYLSTTAPTEIGCAWTGLALVEIAGLHNSHLSHLSRRSALTFQHGTEDVLSVPYVKDAGVATLEPAVSEWLATCEARDVEETGEKEERDIQTFRVAEGDSIDSSLVALEAFTSSHPSFLVVLTGVPSSTASAHLKRQLVEPTSESVEDVWEELMEEAEEEEAEALAYLEEGFPDLFGSEEDFAGSDEEELDDAKVLKHKNKNKNKNGTDEAKDNSDGYYDLIKAHGNSTHNNGTRGPLLEHATILSTPVITALLISFFILLPILAFGVYALAGIQVPPYLLSISKSAGPTQSKKDQ
ncbi:hypothetical protein QFC22_001405 [Naganishia vaughanmartiniae]|uniref:Uncharacterized protein n=1 Tax=Naganishia vaughanmartiniae TaxID=1424756 RepID=A0ACC2XIK7_9TREE|nr:hypothetical protein QFC22_001405 [Naganishia vaughanmartiniae]